MAILQTLFTDGWLYVLLYVGLFGFVLFESSKQYSQLSKPMAWFVMVIMTLFIGLRWETGTDWGPYKELFDFIELDWTFLINVYHFDVGYVLFNGFVRLFSDNYTVFLLINAFVTIYILYRLVIKISPYPNLSLFLFYSAFMLAQFMGSNRRMMAMVFILWGFYYLYERRKLAFAIMIALAFLFHRSSLICFVVLFVPRNIFSIQKTVVVLFLSLIIGLLQLPAKLIGVAGAVLSTVTNNPIVEKMLFYSETGDEHLATSTGSLVLSTILAVAKRSVFLIFYFYVMRKNDIDRLTQYIFNIYIFGFAGYLMFVGSFFQMLTTYFALVEVVLLGRMYSYTAGKAKIVILMIIFAYGFVQMLSALNVYPELYMPYINCFSGFTRNSL